MEITNVQYIALICFALAITHTFMVSFFQSKAKCYREGSVGENFFHLLGEIEIVFGVWAGIFLLLYSIVDGPKESVKYLESRNFTEPMFVLVIMVICASRPILYFAELLIKFFSKLLPFNEVLRFYISTLIIGPLLGSLITEPAAMTVTALILLNRFYKHKMSIKFKYATLGLLFVNISIGGTLTPFAAPPVLMVASKWNWDLNFMLSNFGWKAAMAVVLSTVAVTFRYRKELKTFSTDQAHLSNVKSPAWLVISHLVLLIGIIVGAHHITVFVGLFLLFLGMSTVTKEYQDDLKIREALLVSFFLGGLIVLGGMQSFWLEPILRKLDALPLYLGAMGLTAITDNAAITYLGAQVPYLSDFSKYVLVAGSVVGGGLTVIANAPNPAGYGILNHAFENDGISPLKLFLNALFPTVIAAVCFWFL